MHHIFIDKNLIDFDNRSIVLDKKVDFENYNHLVNSLRIKKGEYILCSAIPFSFTFDYKCKVDSINEGSIVFEIEEEVESSELPVEINLYQGLCKADKLEYIIEKVVELGVNKIIPLETEYSIVKFDANDKRLNNKLERYAKIAKSAAEQSKRHIVPEVVSPKIFKKICSEEFKENIYNILFYEAEKNIVKTRELIRVIKKRIDSKDKVVVNIFVGPEGGFSDKEIEMAKDANFNILTLGKRILRTETAAVASLSILMYEFDNN